LSPRKKIEEKKEKTGTKNKRQAGWKGEFKTLNLSLKLITLSKCRK
jgi:hypothetical protein